MSTASGFLKFTSVQPSIHSVSSPTRLFLRFLHFFQGGLRNRRLDIPIIRYCDHDLFHQCSNFRQKGSRFNKCVIILTFLCSRSSCLSTISFGDLTWLTSIHLDLSSRLIVILANRFSTLFSYYTYVSLRVFTSAWSWSTSERHF